MTRRDPKEGARVPLWVKVAGTVAIALTALVIWAIYSTRNTARSAADWVPEFTAVQGAILHCGNGSGKGISNSSPWWEWTILAEGAPVDFATALSTALEANSYPVTVANRSASSGDVRRLESIGWATTWLEIEGTNQQGISVLARVADGNTINNCFRANTLTDDDPSQADVVAVVKFRDDGS